MTRLVLLPVDADELDNPIHAQLPTLLRGLQARVELFTVVEDRGAYGLEKRTAEARRSLTTVTDRLAAELDLKLSTYVAAGDPAAEILDRVAEARPWLVAMASHARRGPVRWLRGSVAERVLRRCPAPLLLHTPRCDPVGEAFERIVVALDGSERAEQVLPVLLEVARVYSAQIVLVRACNAHHLTMGRLLSKPAESPDLPSERELRASLERARAVVAAAGLGVKVRVAWGDPASEVLEAAREEQADLIALTTHGRSGLSRWLLGSVAEKLLRCARTPLLVQRTASADGGGP